MLAPAAAAGPSAKPACAIFGYVEAAPSRVQAGVSCDALVTDVRLVFPKGGLRSGVWRTMAGIRHGCAMRDGAVTCTRMQLGPGTQFLVEARSVRPAAIDDRAVLTLVFGDGGELVRSVTLIELEIHDD